MNKAIISCYEGGLTPPHGMPPTSFYVGLFDDEGVVMSEFFATEAEAQNAFDRILIHE